MAAQTVLARLLVQTAEWHRQRTELARLTAESAEGQAEPLIPQARQAAARFLADRAAEVAATRQQRRRMALAETAGRFVAVPTAAAAPAIPQGRRRPAVPDLLASLALPEAEAEAEAQELRAAQGPEDPVAIPELVAAELVAD
jgi:hypothetical protein